MVVFYVIGALTALWAVVLAGIGIARPDFPSSRGTTRAVMGLSALLVAGSIGSGIVSGALEEEEHGTEADASEVEEETADDGGGSGAAQEIELSADPGGNLAFDTTELTAEAGQVTLAMANPSSVPHNVSIDGGGVDEEGETVGQDETSTVSTELESGAYTFYCSVPGHREGGMEGTLTVE